VISSDEEGEDDKDREESKDPENQDNDKVLLPTPQRVLRSRRATQPPTTPVLRSLALEDDSESDDSAARDAERFDLEDHEIVVELSSTSSDLDDFIVNDTEVGRNGGRGRNPRPPRDNGHDHDHDKEDDNDGFIHDNGRPRATTNIYMDERLAFTVYCTYIMLHLVDPHFSASVADESTDEGAQFHSSIRRIEGLVHDCLIMCATSQAWMSQQSAPDFLWALHYLPHLETVVYPAGDVEECEVCGRSGHKASSQLVFSGKEHLPRWRRKDMFQTHIKQRLAETKRSWETGESDHAPESDEESEESEESGHLQNGAAVRRTLTFLAGSMCRVRVRTYHMLFHFQTHITQTLRNLLLDQGVCPPYRDGDVIHMTEMTIPRLTRGAHMDRLYAAFRNLLQGARDYQNEERGAKRWATKYAEAENRQEDVEGVFTRMADGWVPGEPW
jgi:hypothetical protein